MKTVKTNKYYETIANKNKTETIVITNRISKPCTLRYAPYKVGAITREAKQTWRDILHV